MSTREARQLDLWSTSDEEDRKEQGKICSIKLFHWSNNCHSIRSHETSIDQPNRNRSRRILSHWMKTDERIITSDDVQSTHGKDEWTCKNDDFISFPQEIEPSLVVLHIYPSVKRNSDKLFALGCSSLLSWDRHVRRIISHPRSFQIWNSSGKNRRSIVELINVDDKKQKKKKNAYIITSKKTIVVPWEIKKSSHSQSN